MSPPMYLEMATTPGYNDMGTEEPMVGMEGAKFGGKSSYFPVANTDDSPLEVEGCKPVMLWMYVRHGTRNPGARDMAKMEGAAAGSPGPASGGLAAGQERAGGGGLRQDAPVEVHPRAGGRGAADRVRLLVYKLIS